MIQREDTLIGEGGERCHMSNRGSRRCLAHLGQLQCGQPCHPRGEGGAQRGWPPATSPTLVLEGSQIKQRR
jgi:hypothetical protein